MLRRTVVAYFGFEGWNNLDRSSIAQRKARLDMQTNWQRQ